MKRDNDLIRAILLTVETQPTGDGILTLSAKHFAAKFAGLDDYTLNEHIQLLVERDYLEAEQHQFGWFITRLTWNGHDFLSNSKVESVWQQAKRVAGTLAFDVFTGTIKEAAMHYAKSQLMSG